MSRPRVNFSRPSMRGLKRTKIPKILQRISTSMSLQWRTHWHTNAQREVIQTARRKPPRIFGCSPTNCFHRFCPKPFESSETSRVG